MEAKIDEETQQRIDDTALPDLNSVYTGEISEQKVDALTEEGIVLDLSFLDSRSVICTNFKFSSSSGDDVAAPKVEANAPEIEANAPEIEANAPEIPCEVEVRKEGKEVKNGRRQRKELDDDNDLLLCHLSNNRKVTLQKFGRKKLVSIRQYYEKDGKQLPSPKGISLTAEQWESFVKAVPLIEAAIKKMESSLRCQNKGA